jgi:hypothetical protein
MKPKNSWLRVDFPRKIHNEIKLISQVTGLSFCAVAVKAMRLGLKEIMKEELR